MSEKLDAKDTGEDDDETMGGVPAGERDGSRKGTGGSACAGGGVLLGDATIVREKDGCRTNTKGVGVAFEFDRRRGGAVPTSVMPLGLMGRLASDVVRGANACSFSRDSGRKAWEETADPLTAVSDKVLKERVSHQDNSHMYPLLT